MNLLVSLLVFLSVSWFDPANHPHHVRILIAHTAEDKSIIGTCKDFGKDAVQELKEIGAVMPNTPVITRCIVDAEA